jgi:hypothetical protein
MCYGRVTGSSAAAITAGRKSLATASISSQRSHAVGWPHRWPRPSNFPFAQVFSMIHSSMPSIVWKGHLTFGLVSIPVKLSAPRARSACAFTTSTGPNRLSRQPSRPQARAALSPLHLNRDRLASNPLRQDRNRKQRLLLLRSAGFDSHWLQRAMSNRSAERTFNAGMRSNLISTSYSTETN